MGTLHNVVKYFSSNIINRKNYNDTLEKHRYLPTTQLEQDHNCSRIVAVCKLIKSVLRIKRGTTVHCREFNMPQFFTEDDWRTVSAFEAILRDTSRLILVCQTRRN